VSMTWRATSTHARPCPVGCLPKRAMRPLSGVDRNSTWTTNVTHAPRAKITMANMNFLRVSRDQCLGFCCSAARGDAARGACGPASASMSYCQRAGGTVPEVCECSTVLRQVLRRLLQITVLYAVGKIQKITEVVDEGRTPLTATARAQNGHAGVAARSS